MLTSLNRQKNKLRPKGGKALADNFRKSITLVSLDSESNNIGSQEKTLEDVPCCNTTSTPLNIQSNKQ